MNFERRDYDPMAASGQSKTVAALFAVALDERGRDHRVREFSVHPGNSFRTHLGQYLLQQVDPHGAGFVDAP